MNVLKSVMPHKATQNRYFQLAFTTGSSSVNFRQANGAIKMVAVDHLKNARLIGPTCLLTPFEMIKFPDQISVASTASAIPVYMSFLGWLDAINSIKN